MSDLDVTWTPLADRFVPEVLREEFIAEAEKSTWHPANGRHPMSPGLALQEVLPEVMKVTELRFREVCYSQAWEVRDDTYLKEPYDPGVMGTYTILGARTASGIRCYILDLGVGIAPVALVLDKKGNADAEGK
jgi:hypothetical protein